MSAVLATLRADIRQRWKSMLVLGLVVALAATAVMSAAALARRTSTAFDRRLEAVHAAGAWLGAERVPMASFATTPAPSLAGLAGVHSEERFGGTLLFFPGVPGLDAADQLDGAGLSTIQLIALDDPREGDLEVPFVISGRLPNWNSPDEIFVSPGIAAAAGWKPGSRVAMQYFDRLPESSRPDEPPSIAGLEAVAGRLDVTVAGIGDYASRYATGSPGDELVLVTPKFSEVHRPIAHYTESLVELTANTTAQQVIDEAATAERGQFSVDVDTRERAGAYRASVRPEVVSLEIFTLIAALVALLVLGSACGREAQSTQGGTAIRRALGMTRAQLAAMHLSRVAITVLGGVAAGAALTVVLSRFVVRGSTRVIDPDHGTHVEGLVVALSSTTLVVLLVVVSVPAVRRLVDSRPGSPPRSSHIAARLAASGAPITMVVGARQAFESGGGRTAVPVRTASVVAGLATGVAVAAGLFAVSLDRLVGEPAEYGVTWNLTADASFDPNRDCPISDPSCDGEPILDERSTELAAFLQNATSVQAWTPYTTATIAVDGQAELTVIGFGDGEVRPVISSGSEPRDGELAMGVADLRERHLKVGDDVATGVGTTLRVVGTAITAPGDRRSDPIIGYGAVATYATAQSLATERTATGYLVMADANAIESIDRDFHAAFRTDAYSISPARDPAEIRDYRRIRGTPRALAVVVSLMAMATLVLGVTSSLQRRSRDLAVLRALGTTRWQVVGIAVAQATISAGVVLIGGVPIGLAAGRAVWAAVERHLGTQAGAAWPAVALTGATIGMIVALAAALIRPCRRAVRTPAAELLRVE